MGDFDFNVGGKVNGDGIDKAMAEAMDRFDFFTAWGWTYLHRVHIEAFRHGGHQQHGGGKWKRLSASTVKAKTRKRRGDEQSETVGDIKILIDSGHLRRLEVETNFNEAGKYTVKVLSPADYAHFHQEGSGRVPKRRVIHITKKDRDNLKAFLRKVLAGSIERNTNGGD